MTAARIKLPKNEGKCLDATLTVVERAQNAVRRELSFPEKSGAAYPVELVCKIGEQTYAFEHTRVEAFPNQIGDGFNFAEMIDGLSEMLESKLPVRGLYQLILPVGATRKIKHHEVAEIRNKLFAWILDAAHSFALRGDRGGESGTPDGVPFRVDLIWQRWLAPAKIFAARGVSNDRIEKNRVAQLMAGIESKVSKLKGWAESGAVDVLILENWDSALSNALVIREAFAISIQNCGHVPSHVYCVDTCISAQWNVWAFRRDGLDEKALPYWEFDPAGLTDPRGHPQDSA